VVILTPEAMQTILLMLGDPDSDVRELARDTVDALAKHGEIAYPSVH
jgi:hypothetical protein